MLDFKAFIAGEECWWVGKMTEVWNKVILVSNPTAVKVALM